MRWRFWLSGGPQSSFWFLLLVPMKTLLWLVWGPPCEPPDVGIGKTRGRHRCPEGSSDEVFYPSTVAFEPRPKNRKCVVCFLEIAPSRCVSTQNFFSRPPDAPLQPGRSRKHENKSLIWRSSRDTVLKNFFVILGPPIPCLDGSLVSGGPGCVFTRIL